MCYVYSGVSVPTRASNFAHNYTKDAGSKENWTSPRVKICSQFVRRWAESWNGWNRKWFNNDFKPTWFPLASLNWKAHLIGQTSSWASRFSRRPICIMVPTQCGLGILLIPPQAAHHVSFSSNRFLSSESPGELKKNTIKKCESSIDLLLGSV